MRTSIQLHNFLNLFSSFRVGWKGTHCEVNINECAYDPPFCLNNGICEDRPNGSDFFKCFCPSGGEYFTGKNCELKKVN
jgi:hypothetical protein